MKWMWIAPIITLALVVGAGEALAQRIVVEAQSFHNIKPSMILKNDAQASGGKCIERPLKTPHGAGETGSDLHASAIGADAGGHSARERGPQGAAGEGGCRADALGAA